MESLIVYPKNAAKLRAIKVLLKAMEIEFEAAKDTYDPGFLKKIKESQDQFKQGKFKVIKTVDLWK